MSGLGGIGKGDDELRYRGIEAQETALEVEATQAPPLDTPIEEAEEIAPEVLRGDENLHGNLIEGRLNEPEKLLEDPPVAGEDLAAGLEKLDDAELAKVSAELDAIEAKLEGEPGKLEETAAKPPEATPAQAAPAAAQAPATPAQVETRLPTPPAPQAAQAAPRDDGGSRSATRTGRAAGEGGASSTSRSEGASAAPAAAGPAGAGRASSGESIKKQDEQGGASRNFTANLGGAEALAAAIGDPARALGDRIDAAVELAGKACDAIGAEVAELMSIIAASEKNKADAARR